MIDIDSALAHLFARKEETKNRWFACFICQQQQQNKEKNTLHFGPEVTQVPLLIRFWSRRVASSHLSWLPRWAFYSPTATALTYPALGNGFTLCHRLEWKRGLTRRMSYAFTLHVFLAPLHTPTRFHFAGALHLLICCTVLPATTLRCGLLISSASMQSGRHFSNLSLSLCGVASGDSLDMLPVGTRWFRNEVFAS